MLQLQVGSGRRIRTSTDADPLEHAQVLSDQDAIDSGRMPAAAETCDDPSDPPRTTEGRRVERGAAPGDGVVDRVEAVLSEAVRSCRATSDIRPLRRALLEALRQLDEQAEDE